MSKYMDFTNETGVVGYEITSNVLTVKDNGKDWLKIKRDPTETGCKVTIQITDSTGTQHCIGLEVAGSYDVSLRSAMWQRSDE